ncbi:pilus assembly protein PilP [Glaciecola sp. KUL10]|uniref:pilus assembly protein PilP n=1 Tax=Glaciecola sp. (strain KUL10) TaxID=2161813 RepID=UPI000D782863|nr:pilus assembly protein PilP [Glaciecola sp. KUL10]GBL03759.1 type IV pilus biogenesis protein PilP [Glaciecola sp. KUL10]
MKKILILLTGGTMLSGCGAKVDDLVVFTNDIKQNTQVSIEAYPEFNKLEPVEYGASDLRSPFERKQNLGQSAEVVNNNANCLQPQRNRQKTKLESYGIDALRMAGVFSINGQQWALIKANDGSLHRVKRGQYIGLFNGKVTSINDTQLVIQELLPDGAGCWKTKQATLTMSSVPGENDNV